MSSVSRREHGLEFADISTKLAVVLGGSLLAAFQRTGRCVDGKVAGKEDDVTA